MLPLFICPDTIFKVEHKGPDLLGVMLRKSRLLHPPPSLPILLPPPDPSVDLSAVPYLLVPFFSSLPPSPATQRRESEVINTAIVPGTLNRPFDSGEGG